MPWFAIRTVYLFCTKSTGANVFEERIVAFEAATWDDAFDKAELESIDYAAANDFERHPMKHAFEQDGAAMIDGYELWSQRFESPLSREEFFIERYSRYAYTPEL